MWYHWRWGQTSNLPTFPVWEHQQIHTHVFTRCHLCAGPGGPVRLSVPPPWFWEGERKNPPPPRRSVITLNPSRTLCKNCILKHLILGIWDGMGDGSRVGAKVISPHNSNEENAAQRSPVTCLKSHSHQGPSLAKSLRLQSLTPGCLNTEHHCPTPLPRNLPPTDDPKWGRKGHQRGLRGQRAQ